ncbi:MAG: hypothetical protein AUJ18_01655 [Candidatus Hydrogenedentes bacterium CG1_02_42_14]|nr:MAG: hypothetical protein AUJ18_01655 [Candidatus Hydrogenedentes bacterium CG1_02_42_14]
MLFCSSLSGVICFVDSALSSAFPPAIVIACPTLSSDYRGSANNSPCTLPNSIFEIANWKVQIENFIFPIFIFGGTTD